MANRCGELIDTEARQCGCDAEPDWVIVKWADGANKRVDECDAGNQKGSADQNPDCETQVDSLKCERTDQDEPAGDRDCDDVLGHTITFPVLPNA